MRKRTVKYCFDKFFWYAVYMLPLIAYVVYLFKGGYETIPSLSVAMSSFGLNVLESSQIYVSLSEIFGVGGIIPSFVSPDILLFMTYFITTFLIHLMVDFVLFIPRIAMKWLDKCYGGDE